MTNVNCNDDAVIIMLSLCVYDILKHFRIAFLIRNFCDAITKQKQTNNTILEIHSQCHILQVLSIYSL